MNVGSKLWIVVGLLVVSGAGAAVYFLTRSNTEDPPRKDPPPEASAVGFREAAAASGITFRMSFLPSEQGAKFKINLYDHGCGVAVGDFDGDGFDDVYFVNQLGPNALYRNKGDGTFEDVTAKAGVGLGDRVCVGATFADYDNDGRPDLYVTSTRGGNVLFRNVGNGVFKDVTKEAGLTLIAHSQTAAFFDFDGDGFLDLYVTNTAKWTQNYDPQARYYPGAADFWTMALAPKEFNILYRNNGNGTFTDVTAKAGVAGKGWGGDVAIFDYDEDGRLDLYVTNMFGASTLYRNAGEGKFEDVTTRVLGRTSWGAIGSKAFDSHGDGRLSLLTVDMHSDMWLPSDKVPRNGAPYNLHKKYPNVIGPYVSLDPEAGKAEKRFAESFKIRYEDVVFGNTLFHKLPDGKYEEVSDKAGLETFWPWGIATGDFNNDGHEDVFLPSGMGYPYAYWPNALMMNNGNGTFTDRAGEFGIEPPPGGQNLPEPIGGKPAPRSSRCAAVADFAHVGRLDLVVNNFNDHPYYFRNNFPPQNSVSFRLTGTKSNRDAIGALVRVYPVGGRPMLRQVHAAGGYLSQSSLTVHFGLGNHTEIERAEIQWPSGIRQRIDHPKANTRHDVKEPAK